MNTIIYIAYITIFLLFAFGMWHEDRQLQRAIRSGLLAELDQLEHGEDNLMALADATRERVYLCRCIGCSDQREAHERELRGQP